MAESVKLIVEAFVSLKDRQSLEAMREHRQRLRAELQKKSGQYFDVTGTIRSIDSDLHAIEEGFTRLASLN
jgi:hypothetical protein